MHRYLVSVAVVLVCAALLTPWADGQGQGKKVKNVYLGKILEVTPEGQVTVNFEEDWKGEKVDKKHTFAASAYKILLLMPDKGNTKDFKQVKSDIEDLKGKLVPSKNAAKVLAPNMRIMCPIYNGGPPENDGTIVVPPMKKKKKKGDGE